MKKDKKIDLALETDDYRAAIESAARSWKFYCDNRALYGAYVYFIEKCAGIGRAFKNALYLAKGDTDDYIADVTNTERRIDKFCAWKIVVDDAKKFAKNLGNATSPRSK